MRLAEASTEKCPASVCAVTAARLSVHRGALRRLDEAVDLLVGEAGEPARLGGDRDRHRLGVALPAEGGGRVPFGGGAPQKGPGGVGGGPRRSAISTPGSAASP